MFALRLETSSHTFSRSMLLFWFPQALFQSSPPHLLVAQRLFANVPS